MNFCKVLVVVLFCCAVSFAQSEPKSLGEIARELRERKQQQNGPSVQAAPSERSICLDPAQAEQYGCRVQQLLTAGKFDELEKMASEARTSKARFPGGGWLLYTFYDIAADPIYDNIHKTAGKWDEHLHLLEHWYESYPESITAPLVLASAYDSYAWNLRGSGFANTVTPEQWRLFDNNIERARRILAQHTAAKSKDPYWYDVMLKIAVAQGWEKETTRALLEQASAFEPAFYYNYNSYVWYLLPKWYGDEGESEAFIEEVSKGIGGEQGDYVYFELSASLNCDSGRDEKHMAGLSWQKIKQGYAVMEKLYGSSRLKKNRFAFMARLAGDKATARQIFASIGDDWDVHIWKTRQRFDATKAWAMD